MVGMLPHGGGAFSGKDATKVDRSASYAARYVAKNIVAADLQKKRKFNFHTLLVLRHQRQSMLILLGTGKVSDDELLAAIRKVFDLRPSRNYSNA